MSVDESLLNRNRESLEEIENQDETENEFSDNIEDDNNPEEEIEGGNEEEPQSLREAVMMAKAKKNEAEEKLKKTGTEIKKTAQAAASSQFLTMCFSAKGISASYGTSPLYGNVHLFLKYTVNNKLRALNLKEGMMLLLWDLALLLLIIIQISIIALIVGFFKNPFEAIKGLLENIFTNWKSIE